ncbi:secretion system protein [Halorientalis sp. IM1011]|nr:secretion system protein [Halorientalis sp. IM1011]
MVELSTIVHGLASLYPYEVETSDELADSLSFLQSEYQPETVVRAGFGAGILSVFLLVPLLLSPLPLLAVGVLMVLFPLGIIHGVHSAPHVLADFRRTRALGDTPNLIGRVVLRMQIQPATENAVRFAAETGRGPLAESLSAHIDRSIGTPRTGLTSFADEWAEEFPAIRRSAALLVTAQDAPEGERGRTLDRALSAILDGTRNQMAEFTSAIQGPTTALYAFGVMLPMALVALIPAATLAGYPVSIWVFVILYNLTLPLLLLAASAWLLTRRPVAFPPPAVTRAHPDVPDRVTKPLLIGLLVGGFAFGLLEFGALVGRLPPLAPVASVLEPVSYLAPIVGFGLGLGAFLLAAYRPIKDVRDYVRDVEEHLVDALYLVGRQVDEDEAVESAVAHAGDRVPEETGEVFEDAAGIQRRLRTSVHEAFLGDYGALEDIPSPRAEGTASLLSIAADEGQPAGRAIVSMADHLEELQEVEAETKRSLATVTGTLEHTASFFAPMVGGATVGLAAGMVGEGAAAADVEPMPVEPLGIVVGIYVVTLCFILTALSIGLRHGLDRSLVGYRIGQSLVAAIPIYLFTLSIVGSIM